MDWLLLHDARMIVRRFVRVADGELVTLVTDQSRRAEAEALALAVDEAGADSIVVDISREVARLFRSETFWTAPPANIVAAVQSSSVSIFTVDETYAFRLDHHVRELFETGPECSIFKVDLGMGSWGLTDAKLDEIDVIGRKLQERFSRASEVRIETSNGTGLALSIAGRKCLPVVAQPNRGEPYGIPIPLWGEYNWAPVEESANGMLVVDGITEATSKLHVVEEPVAIQITKGKVVHVEGGRDAEDLRELLTIDEGASLVGEFGIGGNPHAIPGTETEKALLGTVHIGFGNNDEYPGGTVRSVVHVDGGVRKATVEVDGEVIMESGSLLL